MFEAAMLRFWQMPRANGFDADAYRRKLAAAGFRDVEVRSIRDRVYRPFWRHARALARERGPAQGWNPLARVAFLIDEDTFDTLDYVIARARKPA